MKGSGFFGDFNHDGKVDMFDDLEAFACYNYVMGEDKKSSKDELDFFDGELEDDEEF